jgi:hypothetical protein
MSSTPTASDPTTLPPRYVAVWNEPDPHVRRALIGDLWADDGAQVLVDPPQAIRDAAARLAFPVPALEVRGPEALFHRVTRAYEMFVAPGEFVFAPHGAPARLAADLYGFGWLMQTTADGAAAGGGYDVVRLDPSGRIRLDHQYIGAP